MQLTSNKPGAVFYIIAAVFLAWNAMGCATYLGDVLMSDAQYAERYGEAMVGFRADYPSWATGGYAIAVWGGALASILLLLRRRLSVPLFGLSLIAAVVSFLPLVMNGGLRAASGATWWVMPLIVIVAGLIEITYSRRAASRGYLR